MTRHADFALGLYGELAGEVPAAGNLVWSPYSVASALGVAAAGARGKTHDELARALGGELPGLGGELSAAARPGDAEVAVANVLWTRLGLPFEDDYQRTVLGWPGGALHAADFAGDPEGARAKINAEVEKTTRGLIKELLARGVITPDTAAVIVNALYLKVAWRQPFEEGLTSPRPFAAPSGRRKVPAMRQLRRLPYAAADGWRMVTLPTESDIVVDVLLPEGAGADLPGLDAGALTRLYDAAAPVQVDLALPKFRVETSVTLNGPLAGLGVVTAFDPDRADFSGITPEQICVSKIVHQAVLRLDEQGFEGAAATAVVMRLASAFSGGRAVEFHVDRPFLLLVRHPGTGAIYFLARITEP
ncbi:MAG TPA: serpin family protein [Streptosporangiaceae bacterium]|nr:serpin family protein [Streptosporangiaceae bacterium]